MKEYSKYLKKAEDLGAKEAKIIPAKSIVTAEWVKLKCQFGCNRYGPERKRCCSVLSWECRKHITSPGVNSDILWPRIKHIHFWLPGIWPKWGENNRAGHLSWREGSVALPCSGKGDWTGQYHNFRQVSRRLYSRLACAGEPAESSYSRIFIYFNS